MKNLVAGIIVLVFMIFSTSAFSGILVSQYNVNDCFETTTEFNVDVMICENLEGKKTYKASACITTVGFGEPEERKEVIICRETKIIQPPMHSKSCTMQILCIQGQPKAIFNKASDSWECKCPKLNPNLPM
jgi:hypothetical protein